MYIPKHFKKKDPEVAYELIRREPFATLLVQNQEGVLGSHLPLLLDLAGNEPKLVGHMSRSNPQWKLLEQGKEVLIVFHGPHAYISPKWYEENDVPTWNYAVVHVHGRVKAYET